MKRFSMTRIDLHGTLSRFQFCYFTGLQYCVSTAAEPGFSATKQTTSALFFCRNTPGPAGEVTTPATGKYWTGRKNDRSHQKPSARGGDCADYLLHDRGASLWRKCNRHRHSGNANDIHVAIEKTFCNPSG